MPIGTTGTKKDEADHGETLAGWAALHLDPIASGRAHSQRRIAPALRASDFNYAMTDRRYDDDEAAEIFRKAAEGPQSLPSQTSAKWG